MVVVVAVVGEDGAHVAEIATAARLDARLPSAELSNLGLVLGAPVVETTVGADVALSRDLKDLVAGPAVAVGDGASVNRFTVCASLVDALVLDDGVSASHDEVGKRRRAVVT